MTLETAKKNVGAFITINNERLEITCADSFGATPHYGVFAIINGETVRGWIPCAICPQAELTR